MALIKCPECGKEISDKSKACIHCGYPLDRTAKENITLSEPAKLPEYKDKDETVEIKNENIITDSEVSIK